MRTKSKSIQDKEKLNQLLLDLVGIANRSKAGQVTHKIEEIKEFVEQSTPNSPEEQDIPMPPKRITNVKLRITSIRKGQPKTEVRESATNPHKSYKDVRTEDTGECIFCKTKPHDLSCPNNPNKGSAPLNKDLTKRFKEFLADECYDLKIYKRGGYDKKMINFISQEIESSNRRLIEYATKEKDKALKESRVKAKDQLRMGINLTEFGRFQAFRDILEELKKSGDE